MSTRLDRGASAIEYGLLVAAVATLIIGAVFGIGQQISGMFTETEACLRLQNAATTPCNR